MEQARPDAFVQLTRVFLERGLSGTPLQLRLRTSASVPPSASSETARFNVGDQQFLGTVPSKAAAPFSTTRDWLAAVKGALRKPGKALSATQVSGLTHDVGFEGMFVRGCSCVLTVCL
jgi:hypothetical protein